MDIRPVGQRRPRPIGLAAVLAEGGNRTARATEPRRACHGAAGSGRFVVWACHGSPPQVGCAAGARCRSGTWRNVRLNNNDQIIPQARRPAMQPASTRTGSAHAESEAGTVPMVVMIGTRADALPPVMLGLGPMPDITGTHADACLLVMLGLGPMPVMIGTHADACPPVVLDLGPTAVTIGARADARDALPTVMLGPGPSISDRTLR